MAESNNPPTIPGRFNSPVLIAQVPISLAAAASNAIGLTGTSGLYGANRRLIVTAIIIEDPSTTATLATTTIRAGWGAGTSTVLPVANGALAFTASGAFYQIFVPPSSVICSAGYSTDLYIEVVANGVAAATAKATIMGYLE